MKDVLITILLFVLVYSWVTMLDWGNTVDAHLAAENRVQLKTEAYLKAWSERASLDSMKVFFAKEHCLEVGLEERRYCDFEQIRRQLHWRAQPIGVKFKKELLEVDEAVYSPQLAVLKGHLLPHRWYEKRIEAPQKFILWVKYDTSLHIVEQYWYIKSL